MKAFRILGLAGALFAAVTATGAMAQAAQPVELKGDVKIDRLVTENGAARHVLVDPEVVVPGDRLLFSTAYRNAGAAAVRNFVVTNPVPEGVMLAPEGAGTLEVSVDGGKNWGKLAVLAVANGQGGTRPAQSSDVTHLRWTLSTLAPGAQGTLTYNAIVR